MEYKEILGFVTVILAFVVYIPYYYTVVKGATKPHVYTYLIGAIVNVVAFAGTWFSGAGAASWNIAASGILVVGVLLLSLKFGTKDIKRIDTFFLAAACFSIVPWILTNDPTLSVVLVAGIDSMSMIPTLRKTWNAPYSEPWTLWGINTVKHSIAIAAVSSFSIATVIYPAAMILMNGILAGEIVLRRHKIL